ncbi:MULTISPECIES: hypothetical protein [unclassified Corynebacterium]|uniref:hypothetical protein n=1 Tax=unclassified Corynebacterium TaxID=2624378 RepID=UPI000AB68105|nr:MULTISPECIES: hypothetical protein [unclassified Corynebacterium]MDU1462366.1 hypothetical protein [Corynebacterium sp.]MDU5016979.1 hypothetical protein [Corynebacterium sp.]MDU7103466.1 hypothetical protein [Corynebacterium sp.]
MQIYGYPGERVDFVSKSAAAGSIMAGDSRDFVEEFFGPAHTRDDNEVSYFSRSVVLRFTDDKVREIAIYPQRSQRERIDVFAGKTRLSGLDAEALAKVIAQAGDGLSATAAKEGLGEVIFRL